jgi:hypothetical protein
VALSEALILYSLTRLSLSLLSSPIAMSSLPPPVSAPASASSSDPLDALDHPEVAAQLSARAAELPTNPHSIEAYLESMALVAHKNPDQHPEPVAKEVNASQFDAIQALSAESPADERAENFKSSGNEAYKLAIATKEKLAKELEKPENERDSEAVEKLRSAVRKRYEDAFDYYSHGIAAEPTSKHLLSQLYSNRAQIQLAFENYGHALRECRQALEVDPHNSKAYWRAAQACLKTGKLAEALKYARGGPNCKYILKVEKRSFAKLEQEILERIAAEEELAKRKEEEKMQKLQENEEKKAEANGRKRKLATAVANRGLTMGKPMFTEPGTGSDSSSSVPVFGGLSHSLYSAEATLNPDHTLTWPVLLLYPQVQQSDFIERCHEHSRLCDHLAQMFPPTGESPPWDNQRKFTLDKLSVYVELDPTQAKNAKYRQKIEEELKTVKDNSGLKSDEGKLRIPVDTSQTLAAILAAEPLRKRGYTIPAVPTFVILAK